MIFEDSHYKRLKKYGIDICSKYKTKNKIVERTTTKQNNEKIENGICIEKDYYKNNKLIGKVFNFDPRIKYTYIISSELENSIKCPNCGYVGTLKANEEGCPYCGTNYNIEYDDKNLGLKNQYDNVINSNKYRKITFILTFIVSALIVVTYLLNNSRTMNIYDIIKIFIGTFIVGFVLYYIFYIVDAAIVIWPIKLYKNTINNKQKKFWNKMETLKIDKKTFYNNVNYEIQHYYYEHNNNVIDYDIIDYLELNEKINCNKIYVNSKILIREIIFNEEKIIENTKTKEFLFVKNNEEIQKIEGGINIIKCHNCGASVDLAKGRCEYCHTKINNLQQWYMI